MHPAPAPTIAPEEARLELARRFFEYLGSATGKDLQWWLAGSREDATATVEALSDGLVPVVVEGRECFILASSLPHLSYESDPNLVHLLPPDDVCINRLHRHLLLPDRDRQRLLWPQAPPPGAVVVGGEVHGTWRRRSTAVTITPWDEIQNRHRDSAEAIVARWPLVDRTHAPAGGSPMAVWRDPE